MRSVTGLRDAHPGRGVRRAGSVGNVPVTVTGVTVACSGAGDEPGTGEIAVGGGPSVGSRRCQSRDKHGREAWVSIDSGRRNRGEDRGPTPGAIPQQRSAADAYRVSDDQLRRARLVVARNSDDPDDLRQLLDMLGLISVHPDQPPPVTR
jgi:hypothetical protein